MVRQEWFVRHILSKTNQCEVTSRTSARHPTKPVWPLNKLKQPFLEIWFSRVTKKAIRVVRQPCISEWPLYGGVRYSECPLREVPLYMYYMHTKPAGSNKRGTLPIQAHQTSRVYLYV